jgi:hypothetical protein
MLFMKNYLILFITIAILCVSCNKDEETDNNPSDELTVKNEQWGFALNYTATWCGPCGNWGAPRIHELEQAGNVVAITAHAQGDPMYKSSLYNSFDADRPTGGGIPSFWIGDLSSSDVSTMNSLLARTPVAGIAIQYSKSETDMTIKTKTEFFNTGSGKYFLSVLILEDGINGSSAAGDYSQNGVADPDTYEHDFVLRASSVGNNAYGEEIAQSPEEGTVIEKEYQIALNPAWDQVYAVAILWQVDLFGSPNYKFVNAIK